MVKSPNNKNKLLILAEVLTLFVVVGLFLNQSFFISRITISLKNLAAVIPSVLVDLTNQTRSESSLNSLTLNYELITSAQAKANDMALNSYFAHISPDGRTPWDFIDASGYNFLRAGENLAVNYIDSIDVHNAWLLSPTHRANIMYEGFEDIGIATAEGYYNGRPAIFVAQHFGTKMKTEATPLAVLENTPVTDVVEDVASIAEGTEESSEIEETEVLGSAVEQSFVQEERAPLIVEAETVSTQTDSLVSINTDPIEDSENIKNPENTEVAPQYSSPRDRFFANPRFLMTTIFIALFVLVAIKTIIALHTRSFKLLALSGFLLILLTILLILNNYLSLFKGGVV